MNEGALALALGAGMVAAVNPCGFALLPAYLSLLVVGNEQRSSAAAVGRALLLTAAMTVGFVAVFAIFGLVISPVASSAQQYLPWVTVVIGVLMLGVGLWLVAGRELPTIGRRPQGPALTGSVRSMVLFGASYAAASLTCTIAPFLAIVVASFRAESVLAGSALFVAYALGMGLVVGVAAVAVALARTSLVTGMRKAGRWVPLVAGGLLAVVGAYVAYYGWWEIRVLRGGGTDDPVIAVAESIQQGMVRLVDSSGPLALTLGLVALVAVAVVVPKLVSRALARVRSRSQDDTARPSADRPQ